MTPNEDKDAGWRLPLTGITTPAEAKENVRVSEISRDQVAHLAKLSRLAIAEDEIDHYAEQLDSIIGHISSVADVKEAAEVEPMSHPAALFAAMREDVVRKSLTAEQALDQAPSVDEDRFEVPQILGE